MGISMIKYLGELSSVLLTSSPFNLWRFKRSVERDLPGDEISYTSGRNGLSLTCDSDERINSIFIDSDIFDQALVEIPFLANRGEELDILGKPTKSGTGYRDTILGEYGAWDRFDKENYSIHIEYRPDAARIRRVTLMCTHVVP
ncbi:hypothetical protein NKJ73_25425 [Mesorhizobium sp. M0074]|uniref:hypothetical protein n=1 Tax=Mesorhizobium sp. M0074 TaxID=2956869 RepID=UPI00333B81C1